MTRYDQGAILAAQAQELLRQRIGYETSVDVSFHALWPAAPTKAPTKAPTQLERLEKEAADLENSLASVSAQLARRQAQIEELRRYPENDPFADDTVLRFKKAFPNDPAKLYQYTASKVEGLWYVTGAKSPDGVEWAELISWLGLGVSEITKIAPGRAAKVAWSEAR